MVFLTPLCICFLTCFSMFYRVSLVFLEPFQVWSWLKSWRKKREERSKIWSLSPRNNRAEESDGWSHQEQPDDCSRHLWKFPYLSKISPNHLISPLKSMAPPYKRHPYLYFVLDASFLQELYIVFWRFATCKGEGSISHLEKIIMNPCFLLYFLCNIIQKSCMCHLDAHHTEVTYGSSGESLHVVNLV